MVDTPKPGHRCKQLPGVRFPVETDDLFALLDNVLHGRRAITNAFCQPPAPQLSKRSPTSFAGLPKRIR